MAYLSFADDCCQASKASSSSTVVRSLCLVASMVSLGSIAVALATHGNATVSYFSSPAVSSVTRMQPMQTAAVVPRHPASDVSLSAHSQFSGAEVQSADFPVFGSKYQASSAVNSTFLSISAAALMAAVAGALLSWRRATPAMTPLQPAYMEFGQPEVAMFYTTGQRTSGRKPMEVYNLLDRMGRLVRSNITSIVQSLEDPEKVIEQAVIDMQADLVKIRQSYSEVLATQKRTEVKQKQAIENVEQWQKRAELALLKGDEELAREALRRKNVEQKALDGINAQLDQSGPIAENLLNSMKVLEQKLDEAKATKAQLIARAKSAETSKKVNDMLTGLDTGSAMAAFDRMEEKVQQMEASAEVSGILAEGSTLDKRFKSLEGSSAVDDELAALKRQLEGPKEPERPSLPPSQSEEDAELERIRKALRNI